MFNYIFRDYADLSIDLDLDVVCCICSNTVGLFEDVLVCKCCQNSAHQTCARKCLLHNLPLIILSVCPELYISVPTGQI